MGKKKNQSPKIVVLQSSPNGAGSPINNVSLGAVGNGSTITQGSQNFATVKEVQNPLSSEKEMIKVAFFADKAAYNKRYTKMLEDEWKYGFPGTYGSFLNNYKYQVLNYHPLLSLFFLDNHHPEGKIKRWLALFCSSAWGYFITACFESRKAKIEAEENDDEFASTMSWVAISFWVFFLTYPHDFFIGVLESKNRSKTGVEKCQTCFANCCLGIMTGFGFLWYFIGYLINVFGPQENNEGWSAWLLALLNGYIFWFFIDFPWYWYNYVMTKAEFKKEFQDAVCFDYIGNPNSLSSFPSTPVSSPNGPSGSFQQMQPMQMPPPQQMQFMQMPPPQQMQPTQMSPPPQQMQPTQMSPSHQQMPMQTHAVELQNFPQPPLPPPSDLQVYYNNDGGNPTQNINYM